MTKRLFCLPTILVAVLVLATAAKPQSVRANIIGPCRVWITAPGPLHNGESWDTAYTDLQDALANTDCSEIWVAQGVYTPGADISATFNVPPGVELYGGFDGAETARNQRNWIAHVTILSGDIFDDDANTDGNHIAEIYTDVVGSNSRHVVNMDGSGTSPITSSTILDGFTITAGKSQGFNGAGLYCNGGGAGECSPALTNLVFSGNGADFGGALKNYYHSSPTLTNVTFTGNYAFNDGGAVYNDAAGSATCSPSFTNVTFSNNRADGMGGPPYGNGGAVYNDEGLGGVSSPTFENVTFDGNIADVHGGAIYNYGAGGTSSPELINVTFHGNTAGSSGGAIYTDGDDGVSSPALTNVTFNANTAGVSGGAIYIDAGAAGTADVVLINAILWGDTATTSGPEIRRVSGAVTITYSVVQGGCASIAGADCSGSGNLSTNPALLSLADNGGYTRTMAIQSISSAIDTGSNAACPATDQRGQSRPIDGNDNGAATCDIGAYEYTPNPIEVTLNGDLMGTYYMANNRDERDSYAAANNGPVELESTSGSHILASERFIYAEGSGSDHRSGSPTSYSEMMGFPGDELTTSYYFPWYNNVNMWSQLRFGNPSPTQSTTVSVYLGSTLLGSYPLGPSASTRLDYPGVNGGPLLITSSGGVPIIGAERVIYSDGNGTIQNGNHTSYYELMGFPGTWLSDEYWIPWYNNVNMWSQLRLANPSAIHSTTVEVYLGSTLLGSYPLAAGASTRVDYPGVNSGPLRIVSPSTIPILAAERVIYSEGGVQNGTHTSYSELMAIPDEQLASAYHFPSYSYPDVGTWSQLRFANPSSTTARTVLVFLEGELMGTYALPASGSQRVDYIGEDGGPLEVMTYDGGPIVAAMRVIQSVGGTQTSYSEVTGYPSSVLTTSYWFPWYNNFNFDTEIRMAAH